MNTLDELSIAQVERLAGYVGRTAHAVADDIERIVAETGTA